MYQDLEAGADRAGRAAAAAQLSSLILTAQSKQNALIRAILETQIQDKLVAPKSLHFTASLDAPHFFVTLSAAAGARGWG